MSTSTDGAQPIAALLVATWYPAIDDPGRGRFVADQAEALAATGDVRPLVASFDIAYAENSAGARRARHVTNQLRAALTDRTDVVSPGGWPATPTIPIARLPTPEPYGRASIPPGEEADRRREALELLVDGLDTSGLRGVVHAHTAYPDGFAAAGAARRLGWPLVITEHASFVARQLRQPEHRSRYLEAAGAAASFIAVSETLGAELVAAIPELADKLEVVPNTISVDAFEPRGRIERHPDELIFVGNRKEKKGMVVLLRAFADVLEERPSATLRLIGRSPTAAEERQWQSLAADLGIADAVHFEGPTDRDGVAAALQRASLFVHASPRETFGVVTLEALASGLPVVATQSGGISQILEDRRLGELVPAQDPRMLARAVLRTLDRLDEFDPATLRAAVARFSGDSVAPRIVRLYEHVLAKGNMPSNARADSGPIPWTGQAVAIDGPILVLAHDTDRAARMLRGAEPELLERIILVTHGDGTSEVLPEGIGRVIRTREHVPEQLRRHGLTGPRGRLPARIARVASDPIGWIRRRVLKHDRGERRWQATVAGIAHALSGEDLGNSTGAVPDVVCLDVLDYAVAAPLIDEGRVRPAPGGLSWLADRWASVHPRPPSAGSADGTTLEVSASS
jgi:glycosyltransferase involved in cell wall biosynthesis